ncbi:hypothetical protein T439DRAFT_130252 [Meredithblackwellia eburnea MCA 4105]
MNRESSHPKFESVDPTCALCGFGPDSSGLWSHSASSSLTHHRFCMKMEQKVKRVKQVYNDLKKFEASYHLPSWNKSTLAELAKFSQDPRNKFKPNWRLSEKDQFDELIQEYARNLKPKKDTDSRVCDSSPHRDHHEESGGSASTDFGSHDNHPQHLQHAPTRHDRHLFKTTSKHIFAQTQGASGNLLPFFPTQSFPPDTPAPFVPSSPAFFDPSHRTGSESGLVSPNFNNPGGQIDYNQITGRTYPRPGEPEPVPAAATFSSSMGAPAKRLPAPSLMEVRLHHLAVARGFANNPNFSLEMLFSDFHQFCNKPRCKDASVDEKIEGFLKSKEEQRKFLNNNSKGPSNYLKGPSGIRIMDTPSNPDPQTPELNQNILGIQRARGKRPAPMGFVVSPYDVSARVPPTGASQTTRTRSNPFWEMPRPDDPNRQSGAPSQPSGPIQRDSTSAHEAKQVLCPCHRGTYKDDGRTHECTQCAKDRRVLGGFNALFPSGNSGPMY